MKTHEILTVLGLVSCIGAPAGAQTISSPDGAAAALGNARVQQAQRFQSGATPQSGAAPDSGSAPLGLAPSSPGDAELGQQLLLKRRETATPFSGFATLSAFFTNNAALTNQARVNDFFFTGEVGAGYQRQITRDLTVGINVQQAAFRYAKYDVLDFESFNAGASLTYTPGFLGGAALSIGYNYNRLTDGQKHDEFFKNQTLTLAAMRSFELSKAHSVYIGSAALLQWSEPVALQRNQYGVSLGHHVSWTRSVSSDLSYGAALFDYTHDRQDWNQTLSLSVRWEVTRWFNLTGTISEGFNNSNEHIFNYQVFNAGFVLVGRITF